MFTLTLMLWFIIFLNMFTSSLILFWIHFQDISTHYLSHSLAFLGPLSELSFLFTVTLCTHVGTECPSYPYSLFFTMKNRTAILFLFRIKIWLLHIIPLALANNLGTFVTFRDLAIFFEWASYQIGNTSLCVELTLDFPLTLTRRHHICYFSPFLPQWFFRNEFFMDLGISCIFL